jgi:hypothetical protein
MIEGYLTVVYVNLVTKRRLKISKLNEKLKELGGKATFTNDGTTMRNTREKTLWHHNRYKGGVEMGEVPENKLIDVSIKGVGEDLISGAFISWIIRHFCKQIKSVEVYPENARAGWEED